MMPLTLANTGEVGVIRHVGGRPEIRKHLADLGFIAGSDVTVIAKTGGNLIVQIKESRMAVSRELASKIMV